MYVCVCVCVCACILLYTHLLTYTGMTRGKTNYYATKNSNVFIWEEFACQHSLLACMKIVWTAHTCRIHHHQLMETWQTKRRSKVPTAIYLTWPPPPPPSWRCLQLPNLPNNLHTCTTTTQVALHKTVWQIEYWPENLGDCKATSALFAQYAILLPPHYYIYNWMRRKSQNVLV